MPSDTAHRIRLGDLPIPIARSHCVSVVGFTWRLFGHTFLFSSRGGRLFVVANARTRRAASWHTSGALKRFDGGAGQGIERYGQVARSRFAAGRWLTSLLRLITGVKLQEEVCVQYAIAAKSTRSC